MVQNISKQLISLTREAFFDYVLPAIKDKYPTSLNKFFVNITSSVAYGVADKHSDIDVFILFRDHSDYLKFHEKFDKIIKGIKFPEKFEGMCDKGMRFEFESLKKSDVLDFYRSQSYKTWMNQTEWLLCWLVNSVTIYDPKDYITSFKKKIKFFNGDVLKSKVNMSFILLLKYQKILSKIDPGKEPYLADFYFFKVAKQLMNLVYWSAKKYTPHTKWQYFMLQFIGSYGPKLYDDLNLILATDNPNRLKIIGKWTNLLGKYWFNHKILDKDIYHFYNNEYEFNTQNSNNKNVIFFKNYQEVTKNKDNIFSSLKSLGKFSNFFLNEETNIAYLGKYDYDAIMRLQDKYIDVDSSKISSKIQTKRINYLHFIIWRKIRVINGALKRNNRFNQSWYANQAIEHIIEMSFRLKKEKLPSEFVQLPSFKSSNYFSEIYPLLIKSFKLDIPHKIEVLWKCFFILEAYIRKNKILSKFQIDNPLEIQFDIEYWKYENLRL